MENIQDIKYLENLVENGEGCGKSKENSFHVSMDEDSFNGCSDSADGECEGEY